MKIKKVGIIGAGTMGAGIAAHLANANIPVLLLDIITPNLAPDEVNQPEARNRLVTTLFGRMANGRPVQLGRPERGSLVTLGNIKDDFDKLADCDWVIEVIIEKLGPKQVLMARLEQICKPNAIISSNTSGIPISQIAENCTAAFRHRFLGTHFFNPPRYLKLLELIPTADTDPEIVETMRSFGQTTLGKGVVICKDTPNFIANRFGAVTGAFIAETALANGYPVAEADMLLGQLIGRPKTGYFRLADLVGLDVRCNVLRNLYPTIPHDPFRGLLVGKTFWPVFDQMLENGWLGNKAGQGFIKKVMVAGKRQFWTLDVNDFAYKPSKISSYPSVEAVKGVRGVVMRVKQLLTTNDQGAWLVRQVIGNMLAYAAHVTPKIAYSLADVDNAVRWGFNYELGPFELWDGLGVQETAVLLEADGHPVPKWVKQMLAAGRPTFYADGAVYDPTNQTGKPLSHDPHHWPIATIRREKTAVASNDSATLHNMGDGVLLLEFHGKANAIDANMLAQGEDALERLSAEAVSGLVIGNEGRHFSAGARLSATMSEDPAATAEAWLKRGQQLMLGLRYAEKPVVTAVHGRALGGGAELAMASWQSVAAHEVGMGLVEFNVGRVPAWSGMTTLLRRKANPIAKAGGELFSTLHSVLQQLMEATVSSSAWHAKSLGYLRENDLIVMNPEHRLLTAKNRVLSLAQSQQPAPIKRPIFAAGATVRAQLLAALAEQEGNGRLTPFDAEIGRHLATILTGGKSISQPAWVEPELILAEERAASLALRFQEKSVARMNHILKTGKPLRN